MVVENLRIDVTPGGVPLVIHVSQYDAGLRQFNFTPYDKGVAMAKISGATVAVEATKPDGYAVQHPCTYNNDGTITYVLQEQLAAVEGQVWSKLTWRNSNGDILGAKAIIWAVDTAGIEDGAVVSESDIPLVEQAANFAATYEEVVAEMIAEMQIVPGQVVIDGTLTVPGAAADAKATGDKIKGILTPELKEALINCFENVYWASEDAPVYITALKEALGYTNYLYHLPSPIVIDGSTGYLVTDATPFSAESPFTVLCEYLEGGTNWDVSQTIAQTAAYIEQESTGAALVMSTYKTTNAQNVNTRVSIFGIQYLVREPRANCGHRRIRYAFSYDPTTRLYTAVISSNGVLMTPYTDQTQTVVPFATSSKPLILGATASFVELMVGTITQFDMYNYTMTRAELEQFATA